MEKIILISGLSLVFIAVYLEYFTTVDIIRFKYGYIFPINILLGIGIPLFFLGIILYLLKYL